MILKKPYKFLIKNFRAIHLIITILMAYILYKYNFIVNFFNTVNANYTGIITNDATGSLYNLLMYFVIGLIIIFSIVLIGLLYVKKKPVKLYISTIAIYIAVFILIAYSYSVVNEMQLKIIDPKLIRNVRDFLLVGYGIQVVGIILFLIRTLGFDIKKFDFKNDLKEFEITEEDDEEFELQINIDTNKAHRKFNRGKRFFGYFYKENRYIFFLISAACIVILSIAIYLGMGVYSKKYTQTEHFKTSEFMMAITNAYTTNKDYRGNILSDNKTLVVLELDIKNNSSADKQLNLARTELIVGNSKYYHNSLYKDKLIDLGNSYKDEKIERDFTKYLLVYEVPNNLMSDKIKFQYVDKSANLAKLDAKTVTVEINPRNLDKNKKTIEYSLGDTIDFSGSILGKTTLSIQNVFIKENFDLWYKFCTNTKCYNSIERVKPTIINNYDKALLRLMSNIEWDDSVASSKKTNLFNFLSMFGTFKYTLNGEEKTDFTTLKQVVPNKTKTNDVYFLEVINEMLNADNIDLILNVRDYTYIYHLNLMK